MTMRKVSRIAMPVALMCCPMPVQAADVAFSGSVTNAVSNVGSAPCQTDYFNTFVLPTSGAGSPLGAFTYESSVCQRPGFPFNGSFKIVLADGSFEGTQAGLAMPQPPFPPTLFNLLINYTITGGTGAYAGATGSFIGEGTVNTSSGRSLITLNFRAVPEPATWAMMLVGFAGIGMAMRTSRARPVLQVA